MSAYNLVPAWKMHSLQARQPRRQPQAPAAAAPAVLIGELPFLTRRVLRIIADKPDINVADLDKLADLETSARPTADALVLQSLARRDGTRYTLTREGQHTLLHSHVDGDRDLGLRAAFYLDIQ